MGYIWNSTEKNRLSVLKFVEQHGPVTVKQIQQYLASLGYPASSARWHLNKLTEKGLLKKIGGPTYYEIEGKK